MNGFDKELHVAMVATATVIIHYASDVAGVWDQVVQHYLTSNHIGSNLTKLETSAPSTHRLYTSSKPRTGAI